MRLQLRPPVYAENGQYSIITQLFGGNPDMYKARGLDIKGHTGIDIATRNGQNVYAAHAGSVLRRTTDKFGALGIVLRTQDKFAYEDSDVLFSTRYGHLQGYEKKQGDIVSVGDVIGYAGQTGFATGPHLHFEVAPLRDDFTELLAGNGFYGCINPLPFLFQNDMEHIIIGNTQYLRYAPLKIAISIGDTWELEKLRERGLTSQPAPATASLIAGYWIIPGVELGRLKDILNF